MNISKELLSEVLNVNVQTEIYEDDFCSDNTLIYWEFDGYHNDYKNINIFELADKCKAWAFKKGYVVGTDLDKVNVWSIKERIIINHFEVYFEDYLEFEIKACQWILDNKDSK